MVQRILGKISYDLDPNVEVKDQRIFFIANASPRKLLNVAASKSAGL